ncbi:FecR family protein [Bacteroidota bacterium]
MENKFYIADIIVKRIKGSISSEEQSILDSWINENAENKKIFQQATDPSKQLEKLEIYRLFRKEKVWDALEEELFPVKTVKFTTSRILRLAAAILLPVLMAGGAAYLFFGKPSSAPLADLDAIYSPGTEKAVLILSDGATVVLDNEQENPIIQEGAVEIRNENKTLNYFLKSLSKPGKKDIYNELRTPRGGSYQLKLADGTDVWLNAGSSLKFPVEFTGDSRQVYLKGEAYFHVTTTGKSFVVSSDKMDIRVMGTSFNVSAYEDDADYITTLVEGKVRVEVPGENESTETGQILAPNEQAVLNISSSEISVSEVNSSYYTSWMRGKIEFDNVELELVMRGLARWYDFEYQFENQEAKAYHFSARLDRDSNISSILEMLELTTQVKFENKGGKIIIH